MAIQKLGIFTKYEFEEAEELAAAAFPHLQTLLLQNLLAECAEARSLLEFDPDHMTDFVKQHSILSGKMSLLLGILSASADAQGAIAEQQMYEEQLKKELARQQGNLATDF